MTSQPRPLTLRLAPVPTGRTDYTGVCRPGSRDLATQLHELVELWPSDRPGISRVLYSPPDWDDHPRKVSIGTRWLKTGVFPRDDTHVLTLKHRDGTAIVVLVVPPATDADAAEQVMDAVGTGAGWSNERLLAALAPTG